MANRTLAQQFSYTHYDVKEGLAGSNVYAITQDNAGFLWIGTETGLSRFDGTTFRTYTTEDGLPDNEIINLYHDSKDRIWIAPFRKSICYMQNGKLHTRQNDEVLKKFDLRGTILLIEEDASGNLAFMEINALHILTNDGRWLTYNDVLNSEGYVALSTNAAGHFITFIEEKGLEWKNGQLVPFMKYSGRFRFADIAMTRQFLSVYQSGKTKIVDYEHGDVTDLQAYPLHISYSMVNDSVLSDNGSDGAYIYDMKHPRRPEHYLPGKSISRTFVDDQANLWFCTRHEGVFMLNSPAVKNLPFIDKLGRKNSVQAIIGFKDRIWIGTNLGNIYKFDASEPVVHLEEPADFRFRRKDPIIGFAAGDDGHLYCGEDSTIWNLSTGEYGVVMGAVKDLEYTKNGWLISSQSSSAFVLDPRKKLSYAGRIWPERSTALHYSSDTFYIGTLDGLYLTIWKGDTTIVRDRKPLVPYRISSIRESGDGRIWVATFDAGLLIMKHGRIIRRLTRKDGLSSNICRKLFLSDSCLWVGTDLGLNKVTITDTSYSIVQYTAADGLLSNFVNAVYADDSLVYVGTPEGLSYFDDRKMSHSASCRLQLRNVLVSGRRIHSDSLRFPLSRRQNNIRFEYSGISYRSGQEMHYHYFLQGLDREWQTTTDNFLNYPTLEPGDYVLKLYASNRFGNRSRTLSIPFAIDSFWWERWYVWLTVSVILAVLGFLAASSRIRRVRREEQEKTRMREKLVTLEHMALRAQMNPHFIFNSLNSIQHFVMQKDIIGANQYLSGLSKLIRLTLDYSGFEEIRVRDEMDYIRLYLELERNRTMQKFDFTIEMPEEIRSGYYFIPPMILQPFVENSIRHGIRYRTDKNGHIFVGVERHGSTLHFIIRDNGVGREASRNFNRPGHIEYQSRGIELTVQRIGLLKRDDHPAGVTINDIIDETGKVTGTEVVIRIPA